MRKTIAQEEQQLSALQRRGARLVDAEREASRKLAETLKEEQMRADRLESAMEVCGQQMALAISAMVSSDTYTNSLDEESSRMDPSSPFHSREVSLIYGDRSSGDLRLICRDITICDSASLPIASR